MSPSCNLARFAATVTAVVAVLCGPIAASAQKVKVLVVPYAPLYDSIPRATGAQLASTLEGGLRSMDVDVVTVPGEGEGKPVASATQAQVDAVAAARADYERGLKLLSSRRVKPAHDAFEKAIAAMEANGPALLDVQPLVDSYLRLSVTLFLMGREDEAIRGPIPAALRYAPGIRLEAGRDFQQVFIDTVEKVRTELRGAGHGSLRVDTTPPGAKVWVDGMEAEYSPVLINGLLPGKHHIMIKPPAADPYVQVVEIKKGELFRITPDDGKVKEGPVASLVSHLAKNQIDDAARSQLAALAKQHGVQHAVIGGAFAQGANMGIVTYLYAAKENTFVELPRISLDRDMLGATIEVNRVASEVVSKLGTSADGLSVPRPVAADARPGEEKIYEVDFSGSLAAGAAASSKASAPAQAAPASGSRAPVSNERRPIQRQPAGGGGSAPEAAVTPAAPATPAAATTRAPAGEKRPVVNEPPALAFQAPAEDFGSPRTEPAAQANRYQYTAGASIEDETAFERKDAGGLLSKWWFWAGAGVLAAGAVGVGVAAASGGGSDGATGTMRW